MADDSRNDIEIRRTRAADGAALWSMLGELDGLERNTCYAYVLLCDHFTDTCLVATLDDRPVGFVIAYRPPVRPDSIFVWQIGVSADARGRGLGTRLLSELVALPACRGVRYLEATVGSSNAASQALFRGFAEKRGLVCELGAGFPAALFYPQQHEDEDLFRIGPLA